MEILQADAMGQASRGKPEKVFDWRKAAELIRDRKPVEARAGLSEDWFWTGGVIFRDGKIVLSENTYLASTWATPVIDIGGEEIECWIMEGETDWNHNTKWPDEARELVVPATH